MKVLMYPNPGWFRREESGIRRVVEAYYKYLPSYGIELAREDESYDLLASHALSHTDPDVLHCHGLYWTEDGNSPQWEWQVNAEIIHAARQAIKITVPSRWVAEVFQRDMHINPTVVPHGIDYEEWDHSFQQEGYVLWNKNRAGIDVCDPTPVSKLAEVFPATPFVTTFAAGKPLRNMKVTGLLPHAQMKEVIQKAGVYLSTTKETFGIGVLEAMAAGVPVLGWNYGGNCDLIQHGVNGFLAEPGDWEGLFDGLEYCFKYREALGKNGKKIVRQYTWGRAAGIVAEVYAQALEEKNRPTTVSVIIPTYNYGDKVVGAINSALSQTLPAEKIIVVDDGTEDNGKTRKAVKSLSKIDNRVIYIRQNNQGVAVARNTGIDACDSKYVCCLDADDRIGPRFLELLVEELERDRSAAIAYTNLWYTKEDGEQGLSPWPEEFDYDKFIKRQNQVPTCCVFRRDFWKRAGGYNQKYAPMGAGSEDAEFFLRIGSLGGKGVFINPSPRFRTNYFAFIKERKRPPTREEMERAAGKDETDLFFASAFYYSWLTGGVSGNKEYREVDWTVLHPWTKDGRHPFASVATPANFAHAVRQYDEPTVSVIIPVGNGHENTVRNALDSLESQTYRRWEAVVVWDSKIDPNDTIVSSYPFVRMVRLDESGKGAGYARNRGAEHARAPMLLFLDADDWLYPDAIEHMLAAFEEAESQGIIYTDYVGKAVVDDALLRETQNSNRLLDYNPKTKEAVISHKSADYECARAIRQPEPKNMYIWNLITSLVPAEWHKEIGGFDESMQSWEDWDYWIRMAHAGKCFYRLPEQLVVYRFHTGSRREAGLQQAPILIEYLREKYQEYIKEGQNHMPCGTCGGKKSITPTPTPAPGTRAAAEGSAVSSMQDNDYKLVEYTHPNMGQHRVIGGRTGTFYGYHGRGARFYAHKLDIEAQPSYYRVIPQEPERKPVVEKRTVIPSAPVGNAVEETASQPTSQPTSKPMVQVEVDAMDENDLTLIPGISEDMARELNLIGVFSMTEFYNTPEDRLTQIKGIGKRRVEIAKEYLKEINGQ